MTTLPAKLINQYEPVLSFFVVLLKKHEIFKEMLYTERTTIVHQLNQYVSQFHFVFNNIELWLMDQTQV